MLARTACMRRTVSALAVRPLCAPLPLTQDGLALQTDHRSLSLAWNAVRCLSSGRSPEVGVGGDVHRSPARNTETIRVPEDQRDWGGVERTQSVVEQRYTEIKKHREDQMQAAAEVEDGLLLYENQNRMRPIFGSLSFTVPWAVASYCAYAKAVGDLPLESTPWMLVGALGIAGVIARSVSRTSSELTAHRIWLTNGGRDLRVQTFSHWFWGSGPLVKYPANAVIEHIPQGVSDGGLRSEVRLLHIKGDNGPYLVMYRKASNPHPEVWEMVLRGDAGLTEEETVAKSANQDSEAHEAAQMEELRSQGSWEAAVDDKGRKYYWHTATRETRWTKPREE